MKSLFSYVEVKTVTWCKDSHDLFDYESKNVILNRSKVDMTSRIFREGTNVEIKPTSKFRAISNEAVSKDPNYLCAIVSDSEKSNEFYIQNEKRRINDDQSDNSKLFLVVRSLKNEAGNQQGYDLEIGDIIRLGRIEYRVLEYQNHELETFSMLKNTADMEKYPFSIDIKSCNEQSTTKKQCRICLMDEDDTEEVLVNPCNCKGTSEYVHIQCLQDWITSKLKKKMNQETTCFYWKKLICEVCKISLPDLVETQGQTQELIPLQRPESPYILLERIFYDKSKENADNAKMMVLLNLKDDSQFITLGRGHECDLRESDISVSRMHAFIKYKEGRFNITDNNSKFGTLVLLRKKLRVEKSKKLALQFGRTVTTFSLQHSPIQIQNTPSNISPIFMERRSKLQSPKKNFSSPQLKPFLSTAHRLKNVNSYGNANNAANQETQRSNTNLN